MWTGSSTLTLNEAFVLRMLRLYIWPGWMKPSSLPLPDSPVQPSIPTFCSLGFTPSTTHGTFCHLQEHKYVFSSFMWHFSYWENNQIQPGRWKKRPGPTHTCTHQLTHTHIPPPSALSLWLTECCSTVWTSKGGWLYIHSVFSPCALNSSTSSKEEREREKIRH